MRVESPINLAVVGSEVSKKKNKKSIIKKKGT